MANDKQPQPENNRLKQLRVALEAESSDGLKLLQDLEDNPVCSVSVMKGIPCVAVTWKGYVTSTQLRYIHENMLHLLEQHGLSKILGDDTALPTIHEEDQKWIIDNWMPRAIAAGLKAIASKHSESYFGKLSTDHIKAVAPAGLVIRFFDNAGDAEQWLKGFRA